MIRCLREISSLLINIYMVLLFLYIYYYKENMNNSDEYMKSKAIAESIQTMLNRISVLECENERLIKYNSNTIAIVNQLKSENALLMNEINVYKNKESVNKELIATYEETIDKMKSKIKEKENEFKINSEKYMKIINEYKTIYEEMKVDKVSLEKQIEKAIQNVNEIKEENRSLCKEIEKYKESSIQCENLNKKYKEYQILLYKLEFENQLYKEHLKKNNINIANNITYTTSIDIEEKDLSIIKSEIENTQKSLKDYSILLRKIDNSPCTNKEMLNNIMHIMENKTESLITLKKQYNTIIQYK